MKIETKFNIGDRVANVTNWGKYIGTVTNLSINPDLELFYTVHLDNYQKDSRSVYKESELVTEPKPDSIYYAKVHSLNCADPAKDKVLILPMSYLSLERTLPDNIKITYDSNGIFKDIEKI